MTLRMAESNAIPTSKRKLFASNAFFYLRIPLKIAYYVFVTPFNIEIDKKTRTLSLTASYVRKIFSGLMQGLALASAITEQVVALRGASIKEDPLKLYNITVQFFTVLGIVFWIHACWTKRNGFKNLLQSCYRYVPPCESTAKVSTVELSILVGYACLTLLVFCCLHVSNDLGLNLTPSCKPIWEKMKGATARLRYGLYLETREIDIQDEDMTVAMTSCVVLVSLIKAYTWMSNSCLTISLQLISYIAYRISQEYMDFLDRSTEISLEEIRESYRDADELLEYFNKVYSSLYLVSFLASVPFLGMYSIDIFDSGNWKVKIEMTMYMISATIHYLYAAMANYKFTNVVNYVFDHHNRLIDQGAREFELTLYFTKLKKSVKEIGLKGGRFFTINYGFVGTFVGTLTTFLIIRLQFPSKGHQLSTS